MSETTQDSSPVFFSKDGLIKNGHIAGASEPYLFIRDNVLEDSSTTYTLHKSEVFSPFDLATIGHDLLPEVQPSEEKHINQIALELSKNPDVSTELLIRLGSEAMSRYMGAGRSSRDLGIRTVEELIGDAQKNGSNVWKVDELLSGIAHNGYSKGVHNELQLSALSEDAKLLSFERQAEISTEIAGINRQMLDQLYEKYGVNYEEAAIYEKSHPEYREVVTVYPAAGGVISFVETTYHDRDTSHTLISTQKGQRVEVMVGIPEYTLEEGYTASI